VERRRLGSLEVSLVGLGANNFGLPDSGGPKVSAVVCDQERTTTIVRAALDAGVNFIDTAEEYGLGQSEEFIGVALGSRRDEAVIATKCNSHTSPTPGRGAGRDRIVRSVEDSLRRLGTDRIDLLQLHFPDADTPIEETLAAFDELVRSGKVLEVGCCNFTGEMLDEAADVAAVGELRPLVSAQNQYSLLSRRAEADVVPAAERHGMGLLPYWPLAGGLLTGKYRRGEAPEAGTRMSGQSDADRARLLDDRRFDRIEPLQALAEERGHTLLELAMSWLAAHDVVRSIIAGATSPAQVASNARAAEWKLTADDLAAVDAVRAATTPG
jgi:aryl-alcohol dehydrogenase-like predicted oxidoreductase